MITTTYHAGGGECYRFRLFDKSRTVEIRPIARTMIDHIDRFPNAERIFEEEHTEEISLDTLSTVSTNLVRYPIEIKQNAIVWGLMNLIIQNNSYEYINQN
jgi:hypothetical protein